ncbi:unnamed protein product [Zymoseptoria tritici ST99CH_3D1]|uniref:Pre-mRNA polyadenylation factor Fip1 domain-containing protein n=2 Tax=Zymoseptoria tritici TaxID=1047171 RepID=A0A1X7S3W1_ZYMT9|nr:unnamed protein product [Zymoseptoria tritici ST99CH_3D7]SMR58641.1 unnamed protein product [Zymoseptoria tritici ST99CH_1E4]SMR61638.1 unnamed protein product [Zymoseptoria tritici ST99CH_3D1]
MEDDDDDFYGNGGGEEEAQDAMETEADGKDQKMESDSGSEEDSSDDDVQITLEKPDGAKAEPPPGSKAAREKAASLKTAAASTTSPSKPSKSKPQPKKDPSDRRDSSAAPNTIKTTLTHNNKEGKDFPALRHSAVDVNDTPIWPANGKPITSIDIDADLAEHSKPWRLPGTDQTDFFNYGFDEYTWVQYSLRQQAMGNTISGLKAEDAQLKAMFGEMGGPGSGGQGGGGGGGGGGMQGMPPGMPGMPTPEQMQEMMAQGLVPPEFAAMLGMGGGGGMGQQQGGQFGQQQGQFGQGGGFGGNSASPNPQPGQGFQPPQGPSGGQQQQWMPPQGSENYSPQQLQMLQEQQMGGGGGGRGRGRGRRGGW